MAENRDLSVFHLARLQESPFDVAPALGMNSPGRPKEEGGVGCAVGDYDNDGLLDLFVTTYVGAPARSACWSRMRRAI